MTKNYFSLCFILIFALVLRLININEHGIGGDEKNSFFVSQFVPFEGANQNDVFHKVTSPYFTPSEFWKQKQIADFYEAGARVDNGSSAVHSLSLHYWTQLFGVADGTLRGLSVLFSILLIILIFIFVNEHFKSPHLALLTAFLASFEPLYVGWSQVVRTYTMTFFFCLLVTHIFFKIINSKSKNISTGLYFSYGICAFACLMCHYAVFPLFLLHGLLTLLFVRNLKTYLGLVVAMLIPALGMYWWLWHAGGQAAFKFMADSARVYNQMASSSPQLGYLAPTSFKSVVAQLLPIISNQYLLTNGLFDILSGNKNFALSLLTAMICIGLYWFSKNESIKKYGMAASLLIAFFLYSTSKLHFTSLTVGFFLVGILVKDTVDQKVESRKMYLSTWILAVFPLFFLVLFAVQDSNTFRIQQKYAGYGMAFMLILVALALKKLWYMPNWLKYPTFALLLIQSFFIGQTVASIWNDIAPRYLSYNIPRIKNPYITIADKINKNYTPSDTIIYPSDFGKDSEYIIAAPIYSIKDAQLCNFYLPKTATYIQRIDRNEPNKVILKKANGSQQVLFNFEGQKYRY
jgi:Dolichyl-phosphate-mannose-protein mannosyltransferase